jgi:hypothetical protein
VAPEAYEDCEIAEKVWDPKTDVFSFALILYELLFVQKVFTPSAALVMRRAVSASVEDRPRFPADVHPVLREVIQHGWNSAVEKRPTFEWIWKRLRDVGFKVLPDVEVDWRPLSPN